MKAIVYVSAYPWFRAGTREFDYWASGEPPANPITAGAKVYRLEVNLPDPVLSEPATATATSVQEVTQ